MGKNLHRLSRLALFQLLPRDLQFAAGIAVDLKPPQQEESAEGDDGHHDEDQEKLKIDPLHGVIAPRDKRF